MSGVPRLITSILVRLESGFYLGQIDQEYNGVCNRLAEMVSKHDMFFIFLIYSCYMVGHMLGLVITNGRSIGYLDHGMEISHQSHLSLSSGQVILHVGQVCSSSSSTGYSCWGIAKVEMKKNEVMYHLVTCGAISWKFVF